MGFLWSMKIISDKTKHCYFNQQKKSTGTVSVIWFSILLKRSDFISQSHSMIQEDFSESSILQWLPRTKHNLPITSYLLATKEGCPIFLLLLVHQKTCNTPAITNTVNFVHVHFTCIKKRLSFGWNNTRLIGVYCQPLECK